MAHLVHLVVLGLVALCTAQSALSEDVHQEMVRLAYSSKNTIGFFGHSLNTEPRHTKREFNVPDALYSLKNTFSASDGSHVFSIAAQTAFFNVPAVMRVPRRIEILSRQQVSDGLDIGKVTSIHILGTSAGDTLQKVSFSGTRLDKLCDIRTQQAGTTCTQYWTVIVPHATLVSHCPLNSRDIAANGTIKYQIKFDIVETKWRDANNPALEPLEENYLVATETVQDTMTYSCSELRAVADIRNPLREIVDTHPLDRHSLFSHVFPPKTNSMQDQTTQPLKRKDEPGTSIDGKWVLFKDETMTAQIESGDGTDPLVPRFWTVQNKGDQKNMTGIFVVTQKVAIRMPPARDLDDSEQTKKDVARHVVAGSVKVSNPQVYLCKGAEKDCRIISDPLMNMASSFDINMVAVRIQCKEQQYTNVITTEKTEDGMGTRVYRWNGALGSDATHRNVVAETSFCFLFETHNNKNVESHVRNTQNVDWIEDAVLTTRYKMLRPNPAEYKRSLMKLYGLQSPGAENKAPKTHQENIQKHMQFADVDLHMLDPDQDNSYMDMDCLPAQRELCRRLETTSPFSMHHWSYLHMIRSWLLADGQSQALVLSNDIDKTHTPPQQRASHALLDHIKARSYTSAASRIMGYGAISSIYNNKKSNMLKKIIGSGETEEPEEDKRQEVVASHESRIVFTCPIHYYYDANSGKCVIMFTRFVVENIIAWRLVIIIAVVILAVFVSYKIISLCLTNQAGPVLLAQFSAHELDEREYKEEPGTVTKALAKLSSMWESAAEAFGQGSAEPREEVNKQSPVESRYSVYNDWDTEPYYDPDVRLIHKIEKPMLSAFGGRLTVPTHTDGDMRHRHTNQTKTTGKKSKFDTHDTL